MVDLNVMGEQIKALLAGVPGIVASFDHEPQSMNQLPAASVFFDGFGGAEETMSSITYEWRWTIRVYIPMSTSDVKTPQLKLRTLLTDTLKELRKKTTINNTCLYSTVSSGEVFAVMDQVNPLMVGELELVAITQERR